jgi:hypothetical protein
LGQRQDFHHAICYCFVFEKDKVDRFRYFKSCSGAPTTSDTTFDDLDVNFQITDKVITERDYRILEILPQTLINTQQCSILKIF